MPARLPAAEPAKQVMVNWMTAAKCHESVSLFFYAGDFAEAIRRFKSSAQDSMIARSNALVTCAAIGWALQHADGILSR